MKKHPITIVLTDETHKALKKRAEEESRPVAQMARVIIEKELKGEGKWKQKPLQRKKLMVYRGRKQGYP